MYSLSIRTYDSSMGKVASTHVRETRSTQTNVDEICNWASSRKSRHPSAIERLSSTQLAADYMLTEVKILSQDTSKISLENEKKLVDNALRAVGYTVI